MTTTTETVAARKFVKLAIAAGCTLSVNDGGEWTVKRSDDEPAIMAALATTDCDRLLARRQLQDSETTASFLFVWQGGAPDELIADYTDNALGNELWNAWQAAL